MRNDQNLDPLEQNPSSIDTVAVKKAAMIIRSVNHKLRQQIIKLLEGNKRLTVTEIYVRLRIEQSVASQHLAIMRRAGFVETSREGKNIHYSINTQRLEQLMVYVNQILTMGTD
jgi:ArsR family transcriptional regulator, virulence genes transcriptional regulator